MQRTLVQQYVEVDIEKSEVGLWVDISHLLLEKQMGRGTWLG